MKDQIEKIVKSYPKGSKFSRELKSIIDTYKQGELCFQPKYQRGFVWDLKRKNTLIENILLNMPLGNLLIHYNENNYQYSIVDGIQRISTLCDFIGVLKEEDKKIKGYFPFTTLDGSYFNNKDLGEILHGKTYKDLEGILGKSFIRTVIMCEELVGEYTDDQMQLYFDAINAGVPQIAVDL